MSKEKKTEVAEVTGGRMQIYEIGYLFVPSIPEENLGSEVTSFKDFLSEKGAIFISDEFPKMIELAYEMSRSVNNKRQRFSYGYFGWVKFECTTDQAKIIKDSMDKNDKFIRYLMIKTVRANTMSPKKSYNKGDQSKRRNTSKVEEVTASVNEEVIDKEIEALVS